MSLYRGIVAFPVKKSAVRGIARIESPRFQSHAVLKIIWFFFYDFRLTNRMGF